MCHVLWHLSSFPINSQYLKPLWMKWNQPQGCYLSWEFLFKIAFTSTKRMSCICQTKPPCYCSDCRIIDRFNDCSSCTNYRCVGRCPSYGLVPMKLRELTVFRFYDYFCFSVKRFSASVHMPSFNKKDKKIRGKSHRLVYIYNNIFHLWLLRYYFFYSQLNQIMISFVCVQNNMVFGISMSNRTSIWTPTLRFLLLN